jgi:hypothetical protein
MIARVRPWRAAPGHFGGAGSGSQNAVSRGVIGGMLAATFFARSWSDVLLRIDPRQVFKPKTASTPASAGPAASGRWRGAAE